MTRTTRWTCGPGCCRYGRSSATRSPIHCSATASCTPDAGAFTQSVLAGLMVKVMNDRLVWIDCEMTGLDLRRDALIEIATLVTDAELNILDDGVDLVIKPPEEAVAQMSEIVREMHTRSGLLKALP